MIIKMWDGTRAIWTTRFCLFFLLLRLEFLLKIKWEEIRNWDTREIEKFVRISFFVLLLFFFSSAKMCRSCVFYILHCCCCCWFFFLSRYLCLVCSLHFYDLIKMKHDIELRFKHCFLFKYYYFRFVLA